MAGLPLSQQDDLVVQTRFSILQGVVGKLKENAVAAFSQAKPWGEVFDRSSFSRPASLGEAASRARRNAAYFRTNYALAGAGTSALVLAANPWSLIVLAFLALAWFYAYIVRPGPVTVGGRELSEREKFGALAGGSIVTVFFLTSVGTTLFYALGLSAAVIAAHAATRVPDDLFLDEVPEAGGGGAAAGLLSLFGGKPAQQATPVGA